MAPSDTAGQQSQLESPWSVCHTREIQRHRISKGQFLQDTGGEAPLRLEPSRTTLDNHSTPLYSSNAGNSMASWQVKLPTFLPCSRDKVVANDTGHVQLPKLTAVTSLLPLFFQISFL